MGKRRIPHECRAHVGEEMFREFQIESKMDIFSQALDLIKNGEAYTVFIDDTGSNNLDKKSIVRYVGVVIDPTLSNDIPVVIADMLKTLNKTVEATEFHFSDIFQGQGEFRGVDYKLRLTIFRRFVDLFSRTLKPAIFVQSMDSETAKGLLKNEEFPDNISFEEISVLYAFSGLISRIHKYLKEDTATNNQAVVFCDHGIKRSGIRLEFPIKVDTIYGNSVFFIDSKIHPGIQLADFAAFVLNRQQILIKKEKLSDKDITFMLDIQPMMPLFKNTTTLEMQGEYNPDFHLPHILKNQIEMHGKRTTIIGDTRTGTVVTAKPKQTSDKA
jgi:hypothetical protein